MILCHIKTFTFVHCLTPFFLYEQKSVLHIHTIFFIDTFILRSHTLIHICYFNVIQPHLMASKLSILDVNPRLILCIVDFLVNRSQTVRHQAALSSSRSISTGSPQGTVISPVLFTLYTDPTPIWRFCNGRSFELRFCLFCWSLKVL